jgi:large subunit ribosomal protein L22
MAGTNTEQPANKAEQKKTVQAKAPVAKKVDAKAPVKTEKKAEPTEKTIETKKKPEVKKAPKKESVKAYGKSITSSTKVAVAICKFLKRKTLDQAMADLEAVIALKKAVPMKGEIPHRKGRMMSGRFPARAASEFITIIRNLKNNATQHDVEDAVIVEAVANKAQRPFAKGGRARKKKSHVIITATPKKVNKTKKKE